MTGNLGHLVAESLQKGAMAMEGQPTVTAPRGGGEPGEAGEVDREADGKEEVVSEEAEGGDRRDGNQGNQEHPETENTASPEDPGGEEEAEEEEKEEREEVEEQSSVEEEVEVEGHLVVRTESQRCVCLNFFKSTGFSCCCEFLDLMLCEKPNSPFRLCLNIIFFFLNKVITKKCLVVVCSVPSEMGCLIKF